MVVIMQNWQAVWCVWWTDVEHES